jgi:hypothetical protein
MLKRLALLFLALALPAGIWFFGRTSVHSQSTPSPELPADVISVRLQFGVTDSEPRDWGGSLSVSGGSLMKVRNWRPRPGDEVQGAQWKLSTRRGVNFNLRPWEKQRLTAPEPYMLIPGVIVDVKGASARLRVETKNGDFEVDLSSLNPGSPRAYLNGAVMADRVPSVGAISDPSTNSEYQALLPGPDGEMWTAWVAYRQNANSVQARRFNGTSWEPAQTVSGDHRDVFMVQAVRDRKGWAWFIWSAQVNGNFDLYARRWDGKAWSAIERLSEAPQPDIYHATATDSNGDAWVVWQGFRDGKSDIFARRHDGSRWLPEERVSTSPANDWNPSVTADSQGRLYVAWDTYDKGNYDIQMRSWSGGQWSDLIGVASTPLFEAYVTLACDKQNRVWAAWNEAGFEWGKDTGFLLKLEGSPLYEWRKLAVAVYSNGRWEVPLADIESSLPEHLRGYNDIPKLHLDPAGRMWLAFRHRLLRIQDTPPNTPAHRAAWEIHGVAYEGERWSEPIHFPFSNSRQDVRAAFANDSRGAVWAAFPTDHRDYEEFLYERAEAQVARVPLPSTAPAAPRLMPRVVPELRATVLHEDERGDLDRIRGYVMDNAGRRYKIYRGDTHRHTEFSMDGNNDGSLLDAYRYAIDAAELDYLMVSEHNSNAGPDREYINWTLQQMADVFTIPGKFLPLYGYERSLSYPNGHRNVIFAKRGNPTLPIPVEEQKAKTGAKALYEYLKRYDGIAISHTSSTNMGTDWRDNDPEVEPLVEIFQGDRISSEYEGAPLAAYSGNPASAPGGFRPAGYVWNAWAKGYKLGVQASSDHLSTHYSYACTISETFSKEALLQAMKARRSYGATDNIVLDYRLVAGSAEHMQGEIVEHKGPVRLKVRVTGTRPVRQIDIIRSNQIIRSSHDMAKEVSFEFTDARPVSGESYYYVRVQQVDNQMAWSSPIWIRR